MGAKDAREESRRAAARSSLPSCSQIHHHSPPHATTPPSTSPSPLRALSRAPARVSRCRSSAGQRSVEVRLGTRRPPTPVAVAVKAAADVRGVIAMGRLSALTQRLVPSDSFDPAGPRLAVKECWAVTSRHCQWRSRSE